MQTRFNSFELHISQKLAGVQDPDLAGVYEELDLLWVSIEDMVTRSLPAFFIIDEVFVEDVPDIQGIKGQDKTIDEKDGKRSNKWRKKRKKR